MKRVFLLVIFLAILIILRDKARNINNIEVPQNKLSYFEETKKRCNVLKEKNDIDLCYRGILKEIVKEAGTHEAVKIYSLLRKEEIIGPSFDDHLHVHEIGRATAEFQGINIDAFISCPTTFNYGCQHGFFEYALSQTSSLKEAATTICENIGSDMPPKLYYYCYHGVGHGLMMALSYDLEKSLKVCNQLPSQRAVEGCWQGTFMENSNTAITDEEKVLGFSKNDPLSPCNRVENRYVWQCYINHAGYLTKVANLNLQKVAELCLSSLNGGAKPCLQSLGLMTTNPIWQKSVKNVDTINDPKKNAEVAWQICSELPEQTHIDCLIGAVGNIHNFDEVNIARSSYFCSLVNKEYQNTCFFEIGKNIGLQAKDLSEAKSICENIPNALKESCLSGVLSISQNETEKQFDEEDLITNDKVLREAITKIGSSKVIKTLSVIMPQKNLSCHNRAHEIGRMTYEIFDSKAFSTCSSECHSGCYHGATEAFFHDKGTDNLEENLKNICQGDLNRFFLHQCVHGIGHGLMAWSSYSLFDALSSCDTLSGINNQSSCWTGVFMENIVGGLTSENTGHYTKYLSNDPHYPCNIVLKKYKGSCYYLQTSRMLQLFNGDFKKIASECLQAPKMYQKDCFLSMGRDASGVNKQGVDESIKQCNFVSQGTFRAECFSGAVQDTFWDKGGKDKALLFCSKLKENIEVERCYKTIIVRASEVLNKSEQQKFCKSTPSSFRDYCSKIITQKPSQKLSEESFTKKSSSIVKAETKIQIIIMNEKEYKPSRLTIKKGTKVIFRNTGADLRWPASNIHPTHRIYPEFDSKKPIKNGEEFGFVFQKTGIWHFHDHLVPYLTGTITVVE